MSPACDLFVIFAVGLGVDMARHILDIGSGRYTFDRKTLSAFIDEARNRPSLTYAGTSGVQTAPEQDPCDGRDEQEMQRMFDEVMSLYLNYLRCQKVEMLVRLKDRLVEYSIQYQSHVLAEEVLNINSCLPYEHRISLPQSRLKQEE
jgi:hypothetical protein